MMSVVTWLAQDIDGAAEPPSYHLGVQCIKVGVFNAVFILLTLIYSNDVLSEELRVNVTCTRTGRVLWYQDRQLGEHEILEGIYVSQLRLHLRLELKLQNLRMTGRLYDGSFIVPNAAGTSDFALLPFLLVHSSSSPLQGRLRTLDK